MKRIRFRDSEDEGPLSWQEWAVVTAPVFASVWFMGRENRGLFFVCEPALLAVYALGGTALCTGLTVLGPMAVARRSGMGLNGLAERALGVWAAWGMRVLALLFLCSWGGDVVRVASWMVSGFEATRAVGGWWVALSGAVPYVMLSARSGDRSMVGLGRFSVRLGVVVVLAAFVRVRDGVERWPSCPFTSDADLGRLGYSLAGLFALAGPVGILLAEAGRTLKDDRAGRRLALAGWAGPMAVTVLWIGLLGHLTWLSSFYQPSLQPSIHMALLGKAARSASWGTKCILALTGLGAARFACWGVGRVVGGSGWKREAGIWLSGAGLVVMANYAFEPWQQVAWSAGAAALTMLAAVLTVEWIWPGCVGEERRRADGVGCGALMAGAAAGWGGRVLSGKYGPEYAWLFGCYAAAFAFYLGGSYWRRRGKAGGV